MRLLSGVVGASEYAGGEDVSVESINRSKSSGNEITKRSFTIDHFRFNVSQSDMRNFGISPLHVTYHLA